MMMINPPPTDKDVVLESLRSLETSGQTNIHAIRKNSIGFWTTTTAGTSAKAESR